MGAIIQRMLVMPDFARHSVFLWGPRRTGKSYWIRTHLRNAPLIDLLRTDVFADYARRPSLLRERFDSVKPSHPRQPVVIDEVQKLPALLDEVHWLMENRKQTFLLTGSSARKLRRGHANLLAGRARRREMRPLCFPEVDRYDLDSLVVSGLLPPIYLSDEPIEDLRAYVDDYLTEEIVAEGARVDLPSFSEFLRVAALTSNELLSYTDIARESGVSAKVVRGYFDLLEDTMLGYRLEPWTRSRHRRMILTPKFYLFDLGLTNFLAHRRPKRGTPEFGKSLEQLVLMELLAYRSYRRHDLEIRFWRTSTGQEVDFVLDERAVAIEVKATRQVADISLRPLGQWAEEGPTRRRIVVALEPEPRVVRDQHGKIEILPLREFLQQLWSDAVMS